MKRTFLLCLIAVFVYGCSSDGGHTAEITAKSNLKGIEFAHYRDSFEVFKGQYKIFAMLKNTGPQRYKYLQLNASYQDENGKEIGLSIGGPETELMPGDSAVIETGYLFPQKSNLPYKVILTTSN